MPNLTYVQWNARGLTKARLEEFRNFVTSSKPSIILLCETFWNNNFSVKFRSYNVINKNRLDRHGGGVAILIHNSIPHRQLPIANTPTIEAIGISIHTKDLGVVDIISAYCPQGNCTTEEINKLIYRNNHFIVGGDFNAHHGMWSHLTPNISGKSIHSALMMSPTATLITPHSLETYVHPSTGRTSTIDLTISSPNIACDASITVGPYLGSDHLPIIINTSLSPKDPIIPAPKWILNDDHWHEWNPAIASKLNNEKFIELETPQESYDLFYNTILETSHKFFRRTKPTHQINPEKCKPWWTENCNDSVKETRRALAEWRSDPFSKEKMIAWRKKEAVKRKTIINAKKIAWETFITGLNP